MPSQGWWEQLIQAIMQLLIMLKTSWQPVGNQIKSQLRSGKNLIPISIHISFGFLIQMVLIPVVLICTRLVVLAYFNSILRVVVVKVLKLSRKPGVLKIKTGTILHLLKMGARRQSILMVN